MARMGRKWVNEEADEYEKRIVDFFLECKRENKKPTLSGLCIKLGIKSVGTLREYARNGSSGVEIISEITSWAILVISEYFEGNLHDTHGNPAGSIFWLKNDGWSDQLTVGPNVEGFEELCRRIQESVREQEENGRK